MTDKTAAEMVTRIRTMKLVPDISGPIRVWGLHPDEAARELEAWAASRPLPEGFNDCTKCGLYAESCKPKPSPTATAEELAKRLPTECLQVHSGNGVCYYEWAERRAAELIDSTLAQAAAEARREAADEFCTECPGTCKYKEAWDKCPDRAAILGHGEEKP